MRSKARVTPALSITFLAAVVCGINGEPLLNKLDEEEEDLILFVVEAEVLLEADF